MAGLKTISLKDSIDENIGRVGSKERTEYDEIVRIERLGQTIKMVRESKNLTQTALGELIGVKKSHISKLENSTANIGILTLTKVFRALDLDLSLKMDNIISTKKEIEVM